MFLKEIILEGFKSYSSRTILSGFDRHFNAITGLNGSGKSNVLDAICFVFGINDLSIIRATMLQDLIYKSGTAGVTSASVTLVFGNRDGNECPIHYEDADEIIITRQINTMGKSKYTINNSPAQVKRVIDLFCSVQLDVNNPHFLILQGQITKVLNMKPKEILGLIEGTVGTSTYDIKRSDVLKLIEKKDIRLAEIGSILTDEIGPAIERLKSQKTGYSELKKIEKDIQSLEKYRTIFILKQCFLEIDTLRLELSRLENLIETLKDQKNQAQDELVSYKSKDEHANFASEIKNVQDKLKEHNQLTRDLLKEQAQLASDLKNSQNIVFDQNASIKHINEQIQQSEEELSRNEAIQNELQLKLEATPIEQLDKKIEGIRRKIADVAADIILDPDTGEAMPKTEFILKLKSAHREAESSLLMLQAQFEKTKLDRDLIYRQINKDAINDAVQIEKELASLKRKMTSTGDENNQGIDSEHQKLTVKYEIMHAKLTSDNYYFHYNDPCAQFDRSRILGRLGCLFTVKNHDKFGKAIEAAIGAGRLLHLVVDTVETAKLLLTKCSFKQRITIIPLNGIKVPADVQNLKQIEQKVKQVVAASNNCQRDVWSALSLIECADDVRPCFEFMLNTKFICPNLDIAKLIAFHPSLNGKVTITLDGDVFDPAGVLTGGGGVRNMQAGKLLITHLSEMAKLQNELNSVKESLDVCEIKRAKLFDWRNQQQCINHKICDLERKLAMTGISDLRKADSALEDITKSINEQHKCVEVLKNRLEKILKSGNINSEEDIPDKVLKQLLATRKEMHHIEQRFEAMKLEIIDRHKEIETLRCQLEEAKVKEANLIIEKQQYTDELGKLQEKICISQDKLTKYNDQLKNALRDQRQSEDRVEGLKATIDSIEIEIKKTQADRRTAHERLSQCQSKYDDIIHKHPWAENIDITSDGNDENIFSQDELDRLKKIRANLRRTVNTQAVDMLGEKEEQFHELLRKEQIVKGNKMKIQSIIYEWDELKRRILNKSWRSVSRDFGEIFSTLLPGASAKLELSRSVNQNSNDVVDCGLDIHVGFGGQWKESLVELSGGQRSLAAMSLILALLRYKPAPIYIMDEIDAALDMSHTQNMGVMIQRFFHQSQFIIVSLKDGMFKNANVLFKTTLKEGISSVTRFTNA
ncbi:hypothetical protein GJ496_011326 [Pomphorhynchus laevis]|nr:hypothetical protein GJ496_011326 [Pomphorhynchus laevis]